ncbi:MAG: HINT domain-containing protein, partial [Lachnospiraceae bacterium]|nr:HINT domain-containing protein [Lachnospiraceae bacterium]
MWWLNHPPKMVYRSTNGEEIISTFDHPYYVKGKGFVNAGDLCIGCELIDNNGNALVIEQIFRETLHDETAKIYNFQVEDYHTYYVGDNGVLVQLSLIQISEHTGACWISYAV